MDVGLGFVDHSVNRVTRSWPLVLSCCGLGVCDQLLANVSSDIAVGKHHKMYRAGPLFGN